MRVSTDSEVPSLPQIKKSRGFGRSRRHEPEPMPEPMLDVTNALPSTDDFRTSLLMSGLSARFSMLREQDDPKSKIGKASDDSVLFPKQGTKFSDFDYQRPFGLSDIAEVASINGSVRPPFADKGRNDSFSTLTGSNSGDNDSISNGVHSGSIMNRAKPGEGNNLFGGRQKIYKLAGNSPASSKSLVDGGKMSGRTVYDDDISQSVFQKLREREREKERDRERLAREESEAQSSRPPSPPLSGYNRNRETSSTTSSAGHGDTRTSTAATSVDSQRTPSLKGDRTPVTPNGSTSGVNLDRTATKTRRLYESGLDQQLHEQQHSTLNRIDTLSRQRNLGTRTPPLNSPTNHFQPGDRWERQLLSKQSLPNLQQTSPNQHNAAPTGFEFAVKPATHLDSRSYGVSSPPLSPATENEEMVVLPVRPNDRGKATAMGTFARPSQPYDENKYSQRQVQMQQGRDTPPPRKHSPPNAFVPRLHGGRSSAESNATFATTASGRSRSNSSAQRQFLPPGIPEVQPLKEHVSKPTMATFPNSSNDSVASFPVDLPGKSRASLAPLDLSKMNFQNQNISLERPPEAQHPAHRQFASADPVSSMESVPVAAQSNATLLTADDDQASFNSPADSPTLGPTTNMSGLSGMVREHLRSDSNTSSNYGQGSPSALTSRFPAEINHPVPQDYYSQSNPWENDDGWDRDYYGSQPSAELPKEDGETGNVPSPSTVNKKEEAVKPTWKRELESHHTRDGSTETQKERLEFKNELAERRRRVQENLKSMVETDSRSASPIPEPPSSRINPLGLLKTKSSRGSLVMKTREPPQSKAAKTLGIGNMTSSGLPSSNREDFDSDVRRRGGPEMIADGGIPRPKMPSQMRNPRQARRDAQHDRERQMGMRQQAPGHEGHRAQWRPENSSPQRDHMNHRAPPNVRMPPRQRTPSRERPPPVRTRPYRNGTIGSQGSVPSLRSESSPPSRSTPDRSGSEASRDRSMSSNGRYRDDLAMTTSEGTSNSTAQGHYNELGVPMGPNALRSPVGFPGGPSPTPSPMMPPAGRSRSNSRVAPSPNGYSDSPKNLAPLKVPEGPYGLPLSPRPSPTAPFTSNSATIQPSPGASASTTPTFPVSQQQQQSRGIAPRKMSINKSQISEPKFLSSTSRITTVNLPPEASLQNGMEKVGAPPIPPVNPARRHTRGMFGLRKKDDDEEIQPMPQATQSTEEVSTFSDDGEAKQRTHQKLRKISSEGGNLNARARQAASAKPSPAMPVGPFTAPVGNSPPRQSAAEGGMF